MAEALDFFARSLIEPAYAVRPLAGINAVSAEMLAGCIDGRVVMDMSL